MKRLQYFAGGQWLTSKTERYMPVYDPSLGAVMAETPCCTAEEVEYAVDCAAKAFPAWRDTPVMKRVQVLYKVRELMLSHLDELTDMVARENGKAWNDAKGDVMKAIEATEIATSAPVLMTGDSLLDASRGVDTVTYREPLGVFAGIIPFNFPAMIPMGWMTPMCVACGNTIVLKAASWTPMTCMRIAELYQEAGLPDGVLNIVTCSRREAELLLTHPVVKGISFVGSTEVGQHIYGVAASHGKRVQALCEAKNHALVMDDAPIERTAAGIINASFGCAGERCMALPVVVAMDNIADRLVAEIVKKAREIKVGCAYDPQTGMGPVATQSHMRFVLDWIEKGIAEGATLALDGRGIQVPGYENGFFIGPTILDHVTPEMTVGQREVFGPVLCVKRVSGFEEGLALMNANPYANGSVIYTQSGYYAREFARRTDGGMVGVNVGIPVPMGVFSFTGHKLSFFGDQHALSKDGMRFYTETKSVTTRWFDDAERRRTVVDTWDGTTN